MGNDFACNVVVEMVIFVGDAHGNLTIDKLRILKDECDNGIRHMTKKDYVIICGDFGLIWNYKWTGRHVDSNSKDECWNEEEIKLLEWYENCPWTTLVVLGNHENYDRWQTYPISEWHGGCVQKVSDSIIRLMNGEIYEIEGHTYFCMGGARSTDRGYATGTEKYDIHKWWWPEEIPSNDEWENAYNHLDEVDWKVDFIVTHDAPAYVMMQPELARLCYRASEMGNTLEMIRMNTDFIHWFCGHLHIDRHYGKVSVLYHNVVEAEMFLGENSWQF